MGETAYLISKQCQEKGGCLGLEGQDGVTLPCLSLVGEAGKVYGGWLVSLLQLGPYMVFQNSRTVKVKTLRPLKGLLQGSDKHSIVSAEFPWSQ